MPVFAGVPRDWEQVVAGGDHTCGVSRDKSLWCWGRNDYGQIGIDTVTNQSSPVRIGGWENDWTDVTAGSFHSCGIRANRFLWCWGWNVSHQLGDGTDTNRTIPVAVATGGQPWIAVTAGHTHTCALRGSSAGASSGSLWCWGRGNKGQLGNGTSDDRSLPTQAGGDADWTAVSAGSGGTHTCGLRDRALYCWGYNYDGQIGDGPPPIGGRRRITGAGRSWPAGGTHTCAIRDERRPGLLGSEHLRPGRQRDRLDLTGAGRCRPQTDWTAVGLGTAHSCGVRAKELYCWGRNEPARSVTARRTDRRAPVRVGTDNDWDDVDGGGRHTVGSRNAPDA